MSDVCFIIHDQDDADLQAAANVLAERGLKVERQGDSLAIQWNDGPILCVASCQGPEYLEEHAEIGKGSEHEQAMAACPARFEVSFEDSDEVFDEINTLIEVQASLQDHTKGYLFNLWNAVLQGPEE